MKFKYKSDRQLAKLNIDPYGTSTYTNRLLADKQIDAMNEGYKYGVTRTLINLGIGCAVGCVIWELTKDKNKKDTTVEIHDEDEDF